MTVHREARVAGEFPIRRSRRPTSLAVADLMSATAGRRLQARRTNRHRAVFSYQPPRFEPDDDQRSEPDEPTSLVAARLSRLRHREPMSPVGRTVLRPIADAATTVTILRDLARGK